MCVCLTLSRVLARERRLTTRKGLRSGWRLCCLLTRLFPHAKVRPKRPGFSPENDAHNVAEFLKVAAGLLGCEPNALFSPQDLADDAAGDAGLARVKRTIVLLFRKSGRPWNATSGSAAAARPPLPDTASAGATAAAAAAQASRASPLPARRSVLLDTASVTSESGSVSSSWSRVSNPFAAPTTGSGSGAPTAVSVSSPIQQGQAQRSGTGGWILV